ncbi:MAG: RT0821/Lpp0805 family surface protein [Pseudomonadota bacterium]
MRTFIQNLRFSKIARIGILAGTVFFLADAVAPVIADPPPWAPAHGYRSQQKDKRKYYDDDRYDDRYDFGIPEGQCYRETVGRYLGRTLGRNAGARLGSPEGQAAAVIAGTLLGQIFDRKMGFAMDDVDSYCTGLALEQGQDNQIIRWMNPDLYTDYHVAPLNRYRLNGRTCRDFTTAITDRKKSRTKKRTACRRADGSWEIIK